MKERQKGHDQIKSLRLFAAIIKRSSFIVIPIQLNEYCAMVIENAYCVIICRVSYPIN